MERAATGLPASPPKSSPVDLPREPDAIEVPLVWLGLEETPVLAANQFLGQVQDDEFYLSFGLATPPPILGRTDEERRAQAEAIRAVPARTLCRLGMTRQRVEELIRVLSNTLEIHDRQRETSDQ